MPVAVGTRSQPTIQRVWQSTSPALPSVKVTTAQGSCRLCSPRVQRGGGGGGVVHKAEFLLGKSGINCFVHITENNFNYPNKLATTDNFMLLPMASPLI